MPCKLGLMLIIPTSKTGGIPINRETHACQRSRNTHTPFEAQGFPKVPPKRVPSFQKSTKYQLSKRKLYKLPRVLIFAPCAFQQDTRIHHVFVNPSKCLFWFVMSYFILHTKQCMFCGGGGIHIIMVHHPKTFMSFCIQEESKTIIGSKILA